MDPIASRQILVEEYVEGPEVALEGLLYGDTLHPLAIFDKPDPLEGPFFEETIYVTPSRLARRDAVGDRGGGRGRRARGRHRQRAGARRAAAGGAGDSRW